MREITIRAARHGGFVVFESGGESYQISPMLFAGDGDATLAFIAGQISTALFEAAPEARTGEGGA